MFRGATILLSLAALAALAVGIWVITRVHTLDAVCAVKTNSLAGASTSCINQVSFYFVGFALTAGGLITLMLALLMMVKRDRRVRSSEQQSVVLKQVHHEDESLRDVA